MHDKYCSSELLTQLVILGVSFNKMRDGFYFMLYLLFNLAWLYGSGKKNPDITSVIMQKVAQSKCAFDLKAFVPRSSISLAWCPLCKHCSKP